MLGWIAYGRNDLETASAQFAAIAADARRVHLHCACEAMCGIALVRQAQGQRAEAADAVRGMMEMILDANALEYLPLVRGFEARLDLLKGDTERAIAWLELEDGVAIASNGLDAFDHPYLTRVKALLAEGSTACVAQARQGIEAFLDFTDERCHGAHQVEALALLALALEAQEQADEALETMRRSVALAAPARSLRIFLDLGPAAAPLLRRLAARTPDDPFLRRILAAFGSAGDETRGAPPSALGTPPIQMLTPREADVLAGLARRLSYQEIGDELFIAAETVKSHAANIYGKLGVRGRREAVAKAASHGWLAPN
jgi:LuxR family maltose regulon positive regulatory protein